MTSNVDRSLDDIISSKKSSFTGRGDRRGNRGGGRGGFKNFSRFRPSQNRENDKSDYVRGNVNGQWSHDMYSERESKPAFSGSQRSTKTSAKLNISNLHFDVSDTDIEQLFSSFGAIVRCGINYDSSGRSKGSAFIQFSKTISAEKARKEYNNVQLDGMPLNIEFASMPTTHRSDDRPVKRLQDGPRRFNNASGSRRLEDRRFDNRDRNRSRRDKFNDRGTSSGRGRQGKSQKIPTQEELDAELDAYITQAQK